MYQSPDEYQRNMETIGRRLESLRIRPPSDVKVWLDMCDHVAQQEIYSTYPHGQALDDLLRALNAAREDLQSYRSRADPELARHRKKSTDAHIQRLLQQLLSSLVDNWAEAYYRFDTVTIEKFLGHGGFSKDFVARVIERIQKLAQKEGK